MGKSVFAGLKLTEATRPPTVPMDQRLFAPTPKPPDGTTLREDPTVVPQESAAPTPPQPAAITSNPGRATTPTGPKPVPIEAARSERPLTEPSAKTVSRFDINDKPYVKSSFLFTDAEFDRLEDFKLELRRRYDVDATKNDIIRIALQVLYEDYTHEPLKSAVIHHLRAKKS